MNNAIELQDYIPKKGSLNDIFIELDKNWSIQQLLSILNEYDGIYDQQDFEFEGFIKIYITNTQNKKQTKNKKNIPLFSKDKQQIQASTSDIITKYLNESNPLTKKQLNNIDRLFITILYLNPQSYEKFKNHEAIESFLTEKCVQINVKVILILENVKEWKKAQQLIQITSKTKQDLNTNNTDIDQWLLNLQLNLRIDHILTISTKNTIQAIFSCIHSTISVKYQNEDLISYQGRKDNVDLQGAQIAGIENIYQLEWMQMLMSIQGISQNKARAITMIYKSLPSLMQAYKDSRVEARAHLLANIKINSKIDDPNNPIQKKIGEKMSERLYRFFIASDPHECVYNL